MADHDLLIIGAGVSGLSMAHYAANAGLNTRVLEREQRAGGCLHSQRFSGALDGFWLELGAHSAFNSYGKLLAILERLQLLGRLQRRARVSFRLFAAGAVKSIPSQLRFSELLLAPFRLWGLKKTGRSVADYFGRIVGPRNYAAVFEPAFNAVICQPAGEFPATCLFRSRPRRKDAPRGFTLPGGLQTITDALTQQLGDQVELRQTVQRIQRTAAGFAVQTDGKTYTARALCLATPAAVSTQLLQTTFPELAAALAQIQTATVETVGVVVPNAQVKLPPLAGLIGRNEAFFSAVSRDTTPDPAYRGFTFHFRPGVLDEAGKIERIAQVLGISRAALSPEKVATKLNQLPVLRVGHEDLIRTVDKALAGSRLALTGNYFTGVAIEDCVTRSFEEFARLRREE